MNQKENSIRIIRFNKPQKVVSGPPAYIVEYYGCGHQGFENDHCHHSPVGTQWKDIWGVGWHKEQEGTMAFPKENPLSDPDRLKNYNWPDPDDERICDKIYKMHKQFPKGDLFLMGLHRDLLWEKAYMLVGMENMMEYFYSEPEYAKEILHGIMDFQLGIVKHYLKLGVEIVFFSDDLGTQNNLLLGPNIIREFFVPEYKRIFALYKEHDIIVNFHSCGHIEPALEILLELGVDILNPIQATANNLRSIRNLTQGCMALQGAISSELIMSGPEERIREDVREKINLLGKEGGYFCAPDQGMPFPKVHVKALHKAVEDLGYYF